MLLRRWLLGGLVLALVAPALAQDAKPVRLEWKFEKDRTFYQKLATETAQTLQVMGNDVNQTQKQTFILSWTPLRQEDDKGWVLRLKVEAVELDIDVGGNKIFYDSTKEESVSNPLSDFFKAVVGSEFRLTVGPDLKVSKVEGRDEFLQKLTAANAQLRPLLEQVLGEDALKQLADPTFAGLPNREVKKGDSWSRESKLSMGPLGSCDTRYTYTYDGPSSITKLDRISVKSELTYKAPAENAAATLPFKIKTADLKASDATGTVEFDREKGRVAKSTMKLTLKGKLGVDIAGTVRDVELSQTQTTTVTTSDENPVQAPKK